MCPPACRGGTSPRGPQPSARRRERAVEIQNGVGLERSLSRPPTSQAAQKGPDARRRPTAAGEAYSLYVEPAAEGAVFYLLRCDCIWLSGRRSSRKRSSPQMGLFQLPANPF